LESTFLRSLSLPFANICQHRREQFDALIVVPFFPALFFMHIYRVHQTISKALHLIRFKSQNIAIIKKGSRQDNFDASRYCTVQYILPLDELAETWVEELGEEESVNVKYEFRV
jgi:hypothetical protein